VIIIPNDMDEQKYLKHALNAPRKPKEFKHNHNNVKEVMEHPICNKCERVALRHHGWSTNRIYACPHCGDTGVAKKVLRGYLRERGYR